MVMIGKIEVVNPKGWYDGNAMTMSAATGFVNDPFVPISVPALTDACPDTARPSVGTVKEYCVLKVWPAARATTGLRALVEFPSQWSITKAIHGYVIDMFLTVNAVVPMFRTVT